MRQLTKAQKKVLDKYTNIRSVSDLPYEVYEKLVEMNDHETIFQNIDMYLWENYGGPNVDGSR